MSAQYCPRCKTRFPVCTPHDPYGRRCGADRCPSPECEREDAEKFEEQQREAAEKFEEERDDMGLHLSPSPDEDCLDEERHPEVSP